MRARILLLGTLICFLVGALPHLAMAAPGARKPLLTIEHRPFDQPQQQGVSFAIAARIQSPAGVQKAVVYCRMQGTQTFTALPMRSRDEQLYEAIVPDWMTASRGLEYYITATDRLGQSASRGFVGFPLTVQLISKRVQTREERLQVLEDNLRFIRRPRPGAGGGQN
ncbi:MAG: hypothetical protein OEU26_02215 [Candidatus Tectomicrobia bacterium]|nr:hypothetical protein [Candidatus Tectomicrobia bacterium]